MKHNSSYREAIDWIAANDDNDWLEEEPAAQMPSVTASMVADLFEVPMAKVALDLARAAAPYHIKNHAEYCWVSWITATGQGCSLVPRGETNPHSLKRIAAVVYDPASKRHTVSYIYPQGGAGNRLFRTARLQTIRGARRWVAKQLEKFEHPPFIGN
jgi:hypothetical protein